MDTSPPSSTSAWESGGGREAPGPKRLWAHRAAVLSAVLIAVLLVAWFFLIPYPRGLGDRNPHRTALMEQRIEEAREAGVPFEIHQEWISLDRISPEVVRGVIVAEDHRFREHGGVDWQALAEEVRWTGDDDFQWWSPSDLAALARAVGYVWSHRDRLRGRSTITQQLAKNLYFGTERSFPRKAMELIVARRLERHLDKDRILEIYLNVAEFGPGLFGVEAASKAYFGRSAATVDPGSAAELAATLPHPLTSNPARNPRRMLWRKELILRRLATPPGEPPTPLPVPDLGEGPPDVEIPTDLGLSTGPNRDAVSTGLPRESGTMSLSDSIHTDSLGTGVVDGDLPDAGIPTHDSPSLTDSLRSDTLAGRPEDSGHVSEVARSIERCRAGCAGVVYLWSHRMPLSRVGMDLVTRAAKELRIERAFLESEALASFARREATPISRRPETGSGRAMLASGALGHAPALVIYADGRVLGPAIYGYKTAPAYVSAIRRRLERWGVETGGTTSDGLEGPTSRADGEALRDARESDSAGTAGRARRGETRIQAVTELETVGLPGAYFRWVPGRQALAYESRGDIYLLDLSDGESREAPGYVDFIPSPDGRLFVTPAPRRSGMEFYDAREVFEAVEDGEPGRVDPFFTDPAMRDQYPSVGILAPEDPAAGPGLEDAGAPEASATVYRVLTSWFEGIRYRDYELEGGGGEIRPLGPRVEPCREKQLSIPIMSQDGLEVAARDESTGTTKIFRLLEDGRCEEVEDLGVQTGKVAWHWSGRLLAFARPPLRARIGPGGLSGLRAPGSRSGDGDARADHLRAAPGIFLYDRDERRMSRVEGSEDASSVVFPEFIGDDRLVYLVPGGSGEPTVFRIVEGIR